MQDFMAQSIRPVSIVHTFIHTQAMKISGFDWDDGNREKCRKHGVAIADIEAVFANRPRVVPDIKHSELEDRFIAIGRDIAGRALFVAFTLRQNGQVIRPVSARYMHKKESDAYAKESPQTDK